MVGTSPSHILGVHNKAICHLFHFSIPLIILFIWPRVHSAQQLQFLVSVNCLISYSIRHRFFLLEILHNIPWHCNRSGPFKFQYFQPFLPCCNSNSWHIFADSLSKTLYSKSPDLDHLTMQRQSPTVKVDFIIITELSYCLELITHYLNF